MKPKLALLLLLTFLLPACGAGTPAPVTRTPTATQPPTDIPTQTALPTLAIPPSQTVAPPYPTASVVKSNAVAFIAENALWVANVDGSGERKLTDIESNELQQSNYLLQWSPDGKWISYISNDKMWIVSPDGSEKKKVLAATDKNERLTYYDWNSDSYQIAYTKMSLRNTITYSESVRVINLKTGETYEISTHKYQFYGTRLRWSPNGQLLVFNKDKSFIVFDSAKRKITQAISTDVNNCASTANINVAPVWSPNGKWFFYERSSAAHYASNFVCISKLDGTTYRVEADGIVLSDVVWDKTGNFLYFVVGRVISELGDPNLNREPSLQRYDVKAQKLEQLLSLEESDGRHVFLSPDSNTLGIVEILENKQLYIMMDLKSLQKSGSRFLKHPTIVSFSTTLLIGRQIART